MIAPVSRRSFLAQLLALGAGLVASVRLTRRPRELTAEDYIPVRSVYSREHVEEFYRVDSALDRRVPPGYEFYYDPKALHRLQLSDLDERIIATADEREAAQHMARVVEENVRFLSGRRWVTMGAPMPERRWSRLADRIRRAFA